MRAPKQAGGHRIFVAAPMSSFASEQQYVDFRDRVVSFCEELAEQPDVLWVFFAGRHIASFSAFDTHDDALKSDADRIWESTEFILLYPEKIASSALIEVGIALGLKKGVTIVCRERDDLPYVLKAADSSHSKYIETPKILESDFSLQSLRLLARSFFNADKFIAA